jgi:hypothetical protein
VAALLIVPGVCRAAGAERRVLVMPIDTIGRMRDPSIWRNEFSLRLVGKLKGARFTVLQEKLSPRDAVCREAECLARIAQAHRVELIVGAKVRNDENVPPNFHVRVWIFDAAAPVGIAREVERVYPNASESDAADALERQLGEALAPPESKPPELKPSEPKPPDPKPLAPPRTDPAVQAPKTPTFVERHPLGLSRSQRWALGLSGVGVAVLGISLVGQGIVETMHHNDPLGPNGEPNCAPMCTHYGPTVRWQATFYTLGIVAVLGGVAMTTIGFLPSKRVAITPEVAPSGAKLGLRMSF